MTHPDRDPALAERLLRTELADLLPLLRATPPADFDRPTVCAGWSVRDVLAHCAAVLAGVVGSSPVDYSPAGNEADVAVWRGRPLADLLAALEANADPAAVAVRAAGGRLDRVALGVWVHGGDVRDGLAAPWPYGSAGAEDALHLLVEASQARHTPLVHATFSGREVTLGAAADGRPAATLSTDLPTLVRLYSGRRPDPARYRLDGASPDELVLFG